MKIKKIHLVDYKRFHDLVIDLGNNPARIVALVGPNGCGKSSVFDAMLYMNNAYGKLGEGNNPTSLAYHSLLQDKSYSHKKNKILFDQGDIEKIKVEKTKEGMQNTVFSFRSSFRYNNRLNVMESKAVSSITNNQYGASTASDIDQRIENSYRQLYIKYQKYLNQQDCKPSEAKRHIIGELNRAISECLDLEIDNLGIIEEGKGTLYFTKRDSKQSFSFNVLSSGEKEVVDILLDLYLRKDYYKDSIYIIDEPELHLNTSIQRKLLIEIEHMIPEKCQIWIATHSIGFIRCLQKELNDKSQIILFQPENKWASESYVLRPVVKSSMTWRELFKTALDDLASLVLPNTIVYCEGKDISVGGLERGLDAIVYNNIFGEKYTDTLFVSSGGNTELDQRSDIAIAILSKVLPDINILVLKDRDMASGLNTDEKTRQDYLTNNPPNHRVLKRWEIENYLYDKDVLRNYCDVNGLTFDENAYDSLVTDIVNQNLKDMQGNIKKICGINFSINAETFKKNLSKCFKEEMPVYKELEQVIFAQNKQ